VTSDLQGPLCYVFPGQSSWRPGMLRDAARLGPASEQRLDLACELLGRDLIAADREPRDNRDVQIGVFVTSLMHLAALDELGLTAVASLGLSLGEYAHLVHIGALDIEDMLRLVDARGALYSEGPPGRMAAVFPMTYEDLTETVCDIPGVEIVNLNSPTQHVIAGPPEAVDRALEVLEREHVVEAVVIEPRIAMHSSGFASVGARFRAHLERAPWRSPRIAYRPNVDASALASPSRADYIDRLVRHVSEPVLFRASIERCVSEHPGVQLVEVGPRRVVSSLLQRRWIANKKLATDAGSEPSATIAALARQVRGG